MSRAGEGGGAGATALATERLRAASVGSGRLWTAIEVLAMTGSTNADLLARNRQGVPEGLVIAAEAQANGRGRLGRSWQSLPGSALTFSLLLRPGLAERSGLGWVPLLAGVAVATAVREATGLDARLKWPNDVLVGEGKLAGILAEADGDAIVVGIGLNVGGGIGDLPVATATSLELHGAGETDRTDLLAAILDQIEIRYRSWRRAGDPDASGLRAAYLSMSATIGRLVRAELPGGRVIEGTASGLDGAGRLLIWTSHGVLAAVSAGDVWHLR
jgi:BirA family biotin operon repressor/biotin-[acetyl-CoA-carboxylase] ligase